MLSLERMDQESEGAVIAVDRLPIVTQKLSRFCGFNIEPKALDDFFNAIAALIAVLKHEFRLSDFL